MCSEFYNTGTSYLSLKSSVLSPVSTRLTNQYLALEQLRAHYDMISRAKARIDTTSPKSLQSSLSLIDQKKRELWRTRSATSICSANGFSRTASPEILYSNYLEKGTKRHQRLEETGIVSDSDIAVGDKVTWYLNSVPTPKDRYIAKTRKDITNSSKKAQMSSQQQNISIADKISWYLEAVQQGAFASDLASSINGYSSDNQSSTSNELIHPNSSTRQRNLKEHATHPTAKLNSTYTVRSTILPRAPSKNQVKSKLRGMRCYNPPTRRKKLVLSKKPQPVIHEPGSTYDDSTNDSDNNDDNDEFLRRESGVGDTQHIPERLKRPLTRNDQRIHDSYSSPIRRYRSSLDLVSRSEEKYLDFIQNVTEDILNTGIYTDRAIKKALDFHMKWHSGLDPNIMKQLIDQFLDDLCISKEGSTVSDALDITMDTAGRSTPPERDNVLFENNDAGAETDHVFPISVTVTTGQTRPSIEKKDTALDEFESISSSAEVQEKDQVPDKVIFD